MYDEETGLYYLRSRYYASYTGRFICSDEICYLLYNTQNSNARNIFCYCCNNPINLTDPDGYFSWKPWIFTGLALILIGVALLAAPYTGGTSLAAASATLTAAGNAAIATGTTLAGSAIVMEMSSQSNQFAEGSTYGKNSKTNRIDWEYNGNGTGNVHFHDANGVKIRLYSVNAEGIITKLEVSKAVLKYIAGNPEVQEAITKALEKILNLSGK